ncbi:MAG TPA: hypothetical protein DHM37_09145 [Candidatus Cloacimonas sp.]|jgi:hypothetical protein|nr:uncharacterized protein [Candidatus Cloacimonadota bacterium]HCX73870.1 hypothetical protein [Candidatus Cloacimonas sp.]
MSIKQKNIDLIMVTKDFFKIKPKRLKQMAAKRIFKNGKENLILEIAEDGFSAFLTIKETGDMIDADDISDLLNSANIVAGVKEAAKLNQREKRVKEFNKPFLIAYREREESKIKINYLFDRENCYDPAVYYELEEMEQLTRCQKAEPIAKLEIKGANSSSMDIFGNEITPDLAEERIAEKYIGQGVYFAAETKEIVSSKAGYPYISREGTINIKTEFKIEQNIEKQEYNFFGDLIVIGNIINSELEIEGSLEVMGSISKCNRAGVIAKGDIQADYIEESVVVSGGKVFLRDGAKSSYIIAESGVSGSDHSYFIGGLIESGGDVELAQIGNSKQVKTEVDITISPFSKDMIKRFTQLEKREERILWQNYYKLKMEKYLADEIESFHISATKKIFNNCRLRVYNKRIDITKDKDGYSLYNYFT